MRLPLKKLLCIITIGLTVTALAACQDAAPETVPETTWETVSSAATEESEVYTTEAPETYELVEDTDVSEWTWTEGMLDCYGYASPDGPCRLSYQYPENFQSETSDREGEQYRGYWINLAKGEVTAGEAAYGIFIYYVEGANGPTRGRLEKDTVNGLVEREIGGCPVLFGLLPEVENNTGYTYVYYIQLDDEDQARIWIMLSDQEENGMFRQTFENSINFVSQDTNLELSGENTSDAVQDTP